MASRIEHQAQFTHAVAEVFGVHSDPAALRARLGELGGKDAALLEHTPTEEGVRYRLRQGIAADVLPQAVRTLHKGDLIVEREQTWYSDTQGYTGQARATVAGVPGEISAQTTLSSASTGCVLTTEGEVTVRIPMVGGKLESVIAEQVTKLLEREAVFTGTWLT